MPVFGAKWLEKCENAPKSYYFGAFLCDCGGGPTGGEGNGPTAGNKGRRATKPGGYLNSSLTRKRGMPA